MINFNEDEALMEKEIIEIPKGVDTDKYMRALFGDPKDFADISPSDIDATTIIEFKEKE